MNRIENSEFKHPNFVTIEPSAQKVIYYNAYEPKTIEYYNLEEIMVIDSIHMEFKTRAISLLKKEVYNFLPGNLISLKEKFKTKDIVVLNTTINNRKYVLYIAELAQGIDCNGFIICVENFPSLLSKNELLGLESNINLLKTRLFYN